MLVKYERDNNLSQQPDFLWTQEHKTTTEEDHTNKLLAVKNHQRPHFKFEVQVPKNVAHTRKLDAIVNNTLCKEANQKELKSLRDFKTFRVLQDEENLPEDYIGIP